MRRRESSTRMVAAILLAAAALTYAGAVVAAAWNAPDKGFLAFTGRRVVEVADGGPAARAGLRAGDVIAEIDGRALSSTMDYVDRMLRRAPGEAVQLTVVRGGERRQLTIELGPSPVPWSALAASALATLLLVMGLIARFSRPTDVAARRFFRTAVIYALVYAGALSWTHLLVHPFLLAVFCVSLFLAAPLAADFALVFPQASEDEHRGYRWFAWTVPALLLVGVGASALYAVSDFEAGVASDRGLTWTVRCIAGLLLFVVVNAVFGLLSQLRRARRGAPAARGQAKWLRFGFALTTLPAVAAVPVAVRDFDLFLLVQFRPFVIAGAILWFATTGLAVLRVGLADVDLIIHRSLVYALASAAAVLVFVAVVVGLGRLAEALFGTADLVPELVAAVAAAALFGPARERARHWLDRRFYRDRVHYVQAMRELSAVVARLAEPEALARVVVVGACDALRASSGALYLTAEDGEQVRAHQVGGDYPAQPEPPAEGGLAVAVGDDQDPAGTLVLGPRLDGDLYSREDRDLVTALAQQLAVAIANARAYGTIAALTRTLQAQNQEIRELRDKLEDENLYLKQRLAADADGEIVGSSRAIRSLLEQIGKIAAGSASVLLTGESGTGKGLVARVIHASSERADGAFIQVDCGAIPAGVFESELFGHERGAFTGAVRKRRGHFELADGGTLLLDEIGELPLELQPKLLRALQERSFTRVGGADAVTVDVRIIAATNRNLEEMVATGRFREDLYYRLRVIELTVPPLRQRKSDIPALVERMLPRLARRNHRPRITIADDALATLADYAWPGNVRELENVVERAVVLCEGREIRAGDIALPERVPGIEELVAGLDMPPDAGHDEVMAAIEKTRLQAALRATGGNQSGAARSLGMARTTFINKLRRHGLLD